MSTNRAVFLGAVLAGVVIATLWAGGAYIAGGEVSRLDLIAGVFWGMLFVTVYYPLIRRLRHP